MTTSILICDDETEAFEQTRSELGGEGNIRALVGPDLRKSLDTLFKDVRESLSDQSSRYVECSVLGGTAFKDIDVAIVDNNLSALDLEGVRLTAEAMVGYLRAFTSIPYIVSLNKNPDVDFDLRYMVGDYQTHADLALNTQHLSSGVLWQNASNRDDAGAVFAPSYWPNINEVASMRQSLIKTIEDRVNEPVLEVLGFRPEALDTLSRHAKGVLVPHARTDQALRTATSLDFFKASSRALPQRDRQLLSKRIADGDLHAKSIVARVVAADLDKWVRRDAIGPQDVLIDLPHLLVRMPFLLGAYAGDVQKWNNALYATDSNGGDPLGFVSDAVRVRLEQAKFITAGIYSRWPCFWWQDLRDDDELNELFFSCEDPWADVVFCEDISKFVDVSRNDVDAADGPKEFEAEFGGSWSRRHVMDLQEIQYSPRSRLAL